jgi:hypothetical protein
MHSNGRCTLGNKNAINNNAFLETIVFVQIWHIYDVHNWLTCNWILGNKTDFWNLFQTEPNIFTNWKECQVGYKNLTPWIEILSRSTPWMDSGPNFLRSTKILSQRHLFLSFLPSPILPCKHIYGWLW